MIALAIIALVCAFIPAAVFLANLRYYRPPPQLLPDEGGPVPSVSILIPARNEEQNIGQAIRAALASERVDVEVVVMDDHSEDRTAECVGDIAARDGRVRLVSAPDLPEGWCGKQHACWELAREARHELLLFLDADVQLAPRGVARMVAFLQASRADLVSGVPHQQTGSLLEKMVIPLIHFILLGFLPMGRMRRSRHPAYAAGCGQLFLARREGYFKAGGHAAIRGSLHDGITLPRAFRQAGLMTDLCDATSLASCRMYRNGRDLWQGLSKNATEGLARPFLLPTITLFLLAGQVLPLVLLPWAWSSPLVLSLTTISIILLYSPRLIGMTLFGHSGVGVLVHPAGILTLLSIQWYSLLGAVCRRRTQWKGRNYP